MKSIKKAWNILALSLAAGFSLQASVASAATFQYDSYTITNGQDIQVLTPNNIAGQVGQIVLHGAGANSGQLIAAWCLDVFDYLTNSGIYNVGPLTTAGSGSPNPALSNAQISEIGSLMLHGNALINTNTNVSAATQIAIWMVEYGNSFTYSGVSSAVTTLAQQYENNVMAGGQWYCPNCAVTLLSSYGNQNLGYVIETPLPAALPLFASGAGVLGFFSWRRKRKQAAFA